MFKQIKSAIIWTYIYRFRSLLIRLIISLLLIGFIEFIYRDIIEYLQLSKKLEYLFYVIVIKWTLIILIIVYFLYKLKNFVKNISKKNDNKEIKKLQFIHKKMSKKEIRTMAQKIIEQKVRK
ncbi:hypothetical protein [Nitratiruptor sp. YY09-18]|uniref:hypothetical protein n=1 Tax=Nitratiruptor sp. YY09-18 TaxID=2724901 RepID=UPI0019159B58|nr:hypothetical protein [Nitratiruptor sp. YY09-18]BCD68084.1 hypothetical protein NitYY0918_C0995 [Nitratiruptor sp. YY09-18]